MNRLFRVRVRSLAAMGTQSLTFLEAIFSLEGQWNSYTVFFSNGTSKPSQPAALAVQVVFPLDIHRAKPEPNFDSLALDSTARLSVVEKATRLNFLSHTGPTRHGSVAPVGKTSGWLTVSPVRSRGLVVGSRQEVKRGSWVLFRIGCEGFNQIHGQPRDACGGACCV